MLSFSKKFLFIHIPKTGGDSITNEIHQYSCEFENFTYSDQGDDVVQASQMLRISTDGTSSDDTKKWSSHYVGPNPAIQGKEIKHMRYAEYVWLYSSELIDMLDAFTVLRNPYDRVISLHMYYNNFEFNREKFMNEVSHGLEWGSMWNPAAYFISDLVLGENSYNDLNRFPIFSPLECGGKFFIRPGVSFIMKFEDGLDNIFRFLIGKIGIDSLDIRNIRKINMSPKRDHYSSFYDSEMKRLVESVYECDFDLFGYDFDKPAVTRYIIGD